MKVQVKRAFKKLFFFVTKNYKKADRVCMTFSLTPNTSLQRCLNLLFQNQCLLIQLPPLFQRISQSPSQGQQNGKRTHCRLSPYSFRINFKDTSSRISIDPLGLYVSSESSEFPNLWCLSRQKSLQVSYHHPKQRENTHPLGSIFFFENLFSPSISRVRKLYDQ